MITIQMDSLMDIATLFASAPKMLCEEDMLVREEQEEMVEQAQAVEGLRVKEIRQRTGLSQERFCELYALPKRTLENWESGKRRPPEYVINLLERAVDHDLEIKELKRKHTQTIRDIASGKKN